MPDLKGSWVKGQEMNSFLVEVQGVVNLMIFRIGLVQCDVT